MAQAQLVLEWLENHIAPVHFGIPRQDPSQGLLSFAPDGSVIAGHSSSLFRTLSRQFQTPAAWQSETIAAIQTRSGAASVDPTMQPMHTSDGSAYAYPDACLGSWMNPVKPA